MKIEVIVRKKRGINPQCCARLAKVSSDAPRCAQPASYVISGTEFCTSHARADVFDQCIAEFGIGAKQYGD